MKIGEILSEASYLKELKAYVLDLLVAFRAKNINEIDFRKLVGSVQDAGYDIDEEFMTNMLGRIPWVANVDPDGNKITLKTTKGGPGDQPADQPQQVDPNVAKVSDMAGKAADKAIKEK